MKKKASIFLTAAILFSVVGLIMIVGFRSDFQVMGGQDKETIENTQADLGSYSELMKKYYYHSVRDGAVKGAFYNGENSCGQEWWRIASCPDAPPFDLTKGSLTTDSSGFANSYLARTKNYDFGGIKIKETGLYQHFELYVDEERVFAGEFDEFYPVGANSVLNDDPEDYFPVVLETADETQERSFLHSYLQEVSPVRFWYMWRILQEWEDKSSIPADTCNRINSPYVFTSLDCDCPLCGNCPYPFDPSSSWTVESLVEQNVKELEKMFDGNVECSFAILGQDCKNIPIGSTPKVCPSGCKDYSCKYVPRDDPYCYSLDGELLPFKAGDCEFNSDQDPCGGCCKDCYAGQTCLGKAIFIKIEFYYEINCTDKKYLSPVDEDGFKNLMISFKEHVSMRTDDKWPTPECCPWEYYDSSCSVGTYGSPPVYGCYDNIEGKVACSALDPQTQTFTYSKCSGGSCVSVTEDKQIGCGVEQCSP
ncbi:MAG: hypothetical protein KKF44_07980 [Nanoarchaeota archaeon]|nr:hypothetical protein [Nanoarchaeota archaeon]